VFAGLYWQRYGQIDQGTEISGLEEEFDLSRGLPRLLHVKAPAPGREPRLADLMARIRQQASTAPSGRQPSWAGWCATTWRCCSASGSPAEGHPERTALLAAAAEGVRRRAGHRAWPILQEIDAALVSHARLALGAQRFDELSAAGARLSQREAVAAVRDSSHATLGTLQAHTHQQTGARVPTTAGRPTRDCRQ
jgi:hypothetical protein